MSPSNTFPTKCLRARVPTKGALLHSTTALAQSCPRHALWVLVRPASRCFQKCPRCPSPTRLESPLTSPTSTWPLCFPKSLPACPLMAQRCQCLPCCLSLTPHLPTRASSRIVLLTTSATFWATTAARPCEETCCSVNVMVNWSFRAKILNVVAFIVQRVQKVVMKHLLKWWFLLFTCSKQFWSQICSLWRLPMLSFVISEQSYNFTGTWKCVSLKCPSYAYRLLILFCRSTSKGVPLCALLSFWGYTPTSPFWSGWLAPPNSHVTGVALQKLTSANRKP